LIAKLNLPINDPPYVNRMRIPYLRKNTGTDERAHAIAAAVEARREQIGVRVGLCFIIALIFQSLTGFIPAAIWAATYTLLQLVERLLFRDVDEETRLSPGQWIVAPFMMLLGNIIFASFGILEAINAGVWGLLCAALLWSGAILNGAMVSGESKLAFAASIAPPILAFHLAPVFVIENGGTLQVGLAIIAAGVLNGAAAIAIWGASRRLLSATARARETARLALIDPETGLPNRSDLQRKMGTLKEAKGAGTVAVAAIGLDRFESLCSAIGQAPTVDLVRHVASRLAAVHPGMEIARLSTNILGTVWVARDADDARQAMLRLHKAMVAPIMAGETLIDVGVSIGVSDATDIHAPDISIVDRAIIAIEQGRRNRQPVASFDAGLCGNPASNLSLMSEMMRALECGALDLHYQPKHDLRTGTITGVEALVRWSHPQRGQLLPDAFLPMAEETGRIASLTEWVLERAVEDQRRLLERGHCLSVSVNLSGCLIDDEDFTGTVLRIAGDAVGKIILEVTETAIIGNPQVARQTLEALRRAGIGISIDDYGSGFSSLSYLKTIPADELKVDKAFVLGLADDRTDQILVCSVIDLAHNLGLQVVAEGVETEGAMELLVSMGCDLAQGHLIAWPMPLVELENFLRRPSFTTIQRLSRCEAG
jgi:EAL domain-containing protein (putative c-di-GMP-specific phosphodiesterase class I)/GGDEF domain-containing protein